MYKEICNIKEGKSTPTYITPQIKRKGNPIHTHPHIKLGVPHFKLTCELYFTIENENTSQLEVPPT